MGGDAFDGFRRFLLESDTWELWFNCGIVKNNDNCDLGIIQAPGFRIWGNIPKYFHTREADLAEIKGLYDLSYLWKSKVRLY